ncbi:Cytochrome p450 [Thalictrum thalictroides]|uniref:Cytochrome p450 n=1 Tax=Thalictrum thalictroides TaxID=46969 RepID=A0A7J6VAQ5_THATH|nr:Cytochrome p450 [Thalictrum thalictroides]
MLLTLNNNIVSRCAIGRKCEGVLEDGTDKNFGELSRELMRLLGAFCFRDIFPWLGWLDIVFGLVRRMKKVSRELDSFLDPIIDEHVSRSQRKQHDDDHREDFVDILLGVQKDNILDIKLTRENIKALILSIVKETLRLHAPGPLIPAESSTSTNLNGYHLPAKTRVLINVSAIQTDITSWEKPDDFIPERFLNNPIDFKGQDFEFIPFGAGRRGCPATFFGIVVVEYVVANLLYWFNWELPSQAIELDMSETSGVTVSKRTRLNLVPTFHFNLY